MPEPAQSPVLQISDDRGVCVVALRHTPVLDTDAVQALGRNLYTLVEAEKKTRIVLDLSDVRFIASQGLGVLLTMRRKADKAGAKLVLAGVQAELLRVLHITGLDKLLPVFGTVGDAVAAYGAGSGEQDQREE